jgi:hypothetical protein
MRLTAEKLYREHKSSYYMMSKTRRSGFRVRCKNLAKTISAVNLDNSEESHAMLYLNVIAMRAGFELEYKL